MKEPLYALYRNNQRLIIVEITNLSITSRDTLEVPILWQCYYKQDKKWHEVKYSDGRQVYVTAKHLDKYRFIKTMSRQDIIDKLFLELL